MMTRSMRASLLLVSCTMLPLHALTASAENAQSVGSGEAALTYSAGSIREQMPLDGIVNFITGDNQMTGNRMVIGWAGTDHLYLKLKNPGDAALGDLYTVYRRARKVFHPKTKAYLGHVIVKLGVVKVTQLDATTVGAQVVRSFAPISPGDPIMRFTPPAAEESAAPAAPATELEGMILDLQADKNMSLVGQYNIVYLDKGRDDGLQVGDRLDVSRIGNGLPKRKVGEVKILSTEPRTSTGYLYRATARVLVGDLVQYKDHSPVEAMVMDGVEGDVAPLSATPVAAGRSETASAAAAEPRQPSKVRLERAGGVTKLSLDDLVDQLEYESGEVKVKPSAIAILDDITAYLKIAGVDKQIRVEGHADNMEIGPSLKGRYPSNWELSKARAAGIVRYLVEKGGMDSAKLSSVGYGASRPVASNGTEEGRKKNRRIEVVLYAPEEEPKAQPVHEVTDAGLPEAGKYTFNQMGAAPADVTPAQAVPVPGSGTASVDSGSERTVPTSAQPASAPPSGEAAPSNTPGL
ncbi:MAG: OmpA family protein [Nitrospiraceae bacterium]|nr:OmpA family protein [Nitrospiraceae bacterium]